MRNAILALLFFISLLLVADDFPRFGSPDAPSHHHVVPRYIEKSVEETGTENLVTSILISYRGYDTFGEVTVIFGAGIAVILILGTKR